jgi:hypothetical protein
MLKQTSHHVDHLPLSSAKFKNEWWYIYTLVAFGGKEMDKSTLIKYGISLPFLTWWTDVTVEFCRVIVLSDNCKLPLPVTVDCINITHSFDCPHIVE